MGMTPAEAYRLLTYRHRWGRVILCSFCLPIMLGGVAAFFGHGIWPGVVSGWALGGWLLASFLSFLLIVLGLANLGRIDSGARMAAAYPSAVYWVHATSRDGSASNAPVRECAVLTLHLRNSMRFEISPPRADMLRLIDWLRERNPSIRWGPYDRPGEGTWAEKVRVEGAAYCFRNTGAGQGEIFGASGEVVWRYEPPKSRWNFLNGLRGPDFILVGPGGQERLRVRRERTFPMPRFSIVENGAVIGSIRKTGLSTCFRTEFSGGAAWAFGIPLFTVRFTGRSDNGANVRVRFASELVWHVLIDEGQDSVALVAALAFVHSERCRR